MAKQRSGKPAGFELNQDMPFQRRTWRVQHVSRIATALVVLAALLGLVGPGPLGKASAGEPGRLTVEYDRFIRHQGENRLTLKVAAGAAAGSEARVWLDAGYARRMEIEAVLPEPERTEATADRLVLVFALARPGEGFEAAIDLKPRGAGPLRGAVGLGDGPGAPILQLVYP